MSPIFNYDVFISYSHKDKEWVRNILLPNLEEKGIKVIIDFRDFEIGAPSITEMERALRESKKTILVLTNSYINSAWGEFESILVGTLDPAGRNRRLVPLLKEKIDLPPRIGYLTYIDFTDNESKNLSWEKLVRSLKITHGDSKRKAISDYCDKLISDIGESLLKQTVDLAGENHSLSKESHSSLANLIERFVEDIYGDLLFSVGYESKIEKRIGNLREKLLHSQRVLLVGEPGSGKTTLLQCLGIDHINNYKNNETGVVPVLVRLSHFKGDMSFYDYAISHIETLKDQMQDLSFVWLLDAFDEMPRYGFFPEKHELLPELIDFLNEKNFILSCRLTHYRLEFDGISDALKLKISSLSPKQIYEIIGKRLPRNTSEELWGSLRGSDDLIAAWGYFSGYEDEFWQEDIAPVAVQRKYFDAEKLGDDKKNSASKIDDDMWQSHMPLIYYRHMGARLKIHEDSRKLMLMCRNPFNLSILIDVTRKAGVKKLPGNRGVLFNLFSKILISRESEKARMRGEPWGEGYEEYVIQGLTKLACALQRLGGISSLEYQLACDKVGENAERLLKIAEDASLVITNYDVRFTHKLLQEYFATHEILNSMENGDDASQYGPIDWWEANPWEETLIMLGETIRDPDCVAKWVASYNPKLALNIIFENGDNKNFEVVDAHVKQKIVASARQKLSETNPVARALALKVLGILNSDDRSGVGLLARNVPDIEWCNIPSGTYTLGSTDDDMYAWVFEKPQKKVKMESFDISKYPITYSQFLPFLLDHYQDVEYWSPRGLKWMLENSVRHQAKDKLFISNVPFFDINWYEAMAYCKWVTLALRKENLISCNEVIRLPTEAEWEVAARGDDGRIYPWGNTFSAGCCNMNETGINDIAAVGVFRHCETPNQVYDMCGNIWEWCLSDWHHSAITFQDSESEDVARVIRGGAYNSGRREMRCAYRHRLAPDGIISPIGFRIVRSEDNILF